MRVVSILVIKLVISLAVTQHEWTIIYTHFTGQQTWFDDESLFCAASSTSPRVCKYRVLLMLMHHN